jgi:peptidoglycan hydrolase-like protein with peptidoglycan-binding domain
MYKGLRARARTSILVAVAAMAVLPATAFAARFGERTLSTGSHGHDVEVLQSWLSHMGLTTGVDGEFGRNTRWNVRRFEQARSLPINGVLTPDDARVMRRAMASKFRFKPPKGDDETTTPTAPGSKATMASDGLHAVAPADAPPEVQEAITAANKIVGKPYKYGGGHGSFEDSGYDCSGTVSYALHGAGLLKRPLSSGEFGSWGVSGRGSWISVYYNSGHAYAVIAGLRLDTSGSGGRGPRWHTDMRSGSGYSVTHWRGL